VLLDEEDERRFDAELSFFPQLACAPLRADARDRQAQGARILAMINTRFLPYLHGQREPPVLHLLSFYDGGYRIRLHFGHQLGDEAWDCVLSYGEPRFVVAAVDEAPAQEAYWANDLEDFLDGRCDEFSTFCRAQLPAEQLRLWAFLATPLLNSDLVRRRVNLHFERATTGLSPGSWVMEMYAAAPTPQT
jgi:hypothetical protein